jgi:hypothetical protein
MRIFNDIDIKPYMGLVGYKLLFIYHVWSNASSTVPVDTMIWSDNTVGLILYNTANYNITVTDVRLEYIAQKL